MALGALLVRRAPVWKGRSPSQIKGLTSRRTESEALIGECLRRGIYHLFANLKAELRTCAPAAL